MKLKHNTLNSNRGTGSGGGRGRRLFMALVVLGTQGACSLTDSQEAIKSHTQREAEKHGPLADSSCVIGKPPFQGNFEPEVQYAWTSGTVLPDYDQVMMLPAVVDVNGDHIPDIVFNTYKGTNYSTDGVMRAISGDDGHELWTVSDPALRMKGAAGLAAGDIDGDGKVEICGTPESGRGVICFENDGTFKFRTAEDANDYNEWGSPALADLNGDGTPEIIQGNRVYSNTGVLKWVGSDGMGGALGTGPQSFAVDIDGDGKLEVVNDRAVYRADGSLKCANTTIPHGFAAVANFDSDPAGEIVVSGYGKVSLLDDDCTLLWTRDVYVTGHAQSEAGHGGAPNIADFDGDGKPEIGLAGDWNYTVYKADGSVLWSIPTQDYSSGRTTSTTFDFEDDGKLEVIYSDELYTRIMDAATGTVRFQTRNSSGTTHEYPIVADVDGDGAAELLIVTNNHATPGTGTHGLRVWHDKKEGWARARPIWNQHAYSVTNVNEDGTIPAHPMAHWLNPKLNLFRANVARYPDDGSGGGTPASDLIASDVTTSCDGYGSLVLSARVTNQGAVGVPAGVKVSFYNGNPAAGGTLLGTATVTDALPVGGSSIATVVVASTSAGTTTVWAVADDDGTGKGTQTECNEGNNTTSASGNLTCKKTPTNQPPVALCRDVTLDADVYCLGSASVNNGSYDPDNGPSPISVVESPAGSMGPGTHEVVVTVSDGQLTSQCTGHLTVVDHSKPSIQCPAPQVVDACSTSGAAASYSATASDNCGQATVTCTQPSGASFPVGSTAVTCTAKDTAGNSDSCSFDVTVRGDTTAPALKCPTAPVVVSTCATSGTTATFDVSASDSCGPSTVTCSQASGSNFPMGTTPVTCTAKDNSGNTASCNFNVQVQRGASGGSAAPVAGASKGKWLWAPNTRMVTVSLADCAEPAKDACGTALPVETYGKLLYASSDEPEVDDGFGDMPTCGDIAELTSTSVKLRAERTTARNGRVYTLYYSVTAPGGATSYSTCRVTVPQNPLQDAVDDGAKFCVGGGCPAGTTFGSPSCHMK